MDDLNTYFSQFTYDPLPEDLTPPISAAIFTVGSLEVRGSHLTFCDAWNAPYDGVSVAVQPGVYEAILECFSYGTDGRVARLIIKLPTTTPKRGKRLGSFGVDVATAAVCDSDALEPFASSDEQVWEDWLDGFTGSDYGIAGFYSCKDANTQMFYASTGFGDGSYPVYELLENGLVVGAEAVFLQPGQGFFEDIDDE